MIKLFQAAFATTSIVLGATAALAQEQTVSWEGAYVGAFVEGSLAQFDMHDKDCWYCASGSFSEASAEFGVELGYDWQRGSLVYGVSASYSSGPDTASDVWWNDGRFQSELNSMAAIRGRIGYASGANLFYGTGAVLSGDFEGYLAYEDDNQGANPTDIAVDSERRAGLGMGLGFSRMLADNLALELEGEYQSFETGYSNMYDLANDEPSLGDIGFGLSRAVVRVGLNYRF